jgi:uncharacterized protein YoxC
MAGQTSAKSSIMTDKPTLDGETAVKKEAPKKAAVKKTAARGSSEQALNSVISAMSRELKQERDSRDRQMTTLIQELHQGLANVQREAEVRGRQRESEFAQLVSGLEGAFSRVKTSTKERDDHSERMIARLSETVMLDRQTLLEEVHEQEKLQEKKLLNLNKEQEVQTRRTRLIAVPGILVAVFAVIYMFYTVHVMEVAMTSMSHDMGGIKQSVAQLSGTIDVMGQDMRTMTTTIETMSQDMQAMTATMTTMSEDTRGMTATMGQMTRDVNVMTHNVAPAMTGLRQMMPWSP